MLVGKVLQGLKVVKTFFPEAKLGTELPSKGVSDALTALSEVENPTNKDVMRVFDAHMVGVYGGTEIR